MDFDGLGGHPLIRLAAPSPAGEKGDSGDLRSYAIPLSPTGEGTVPAIKLLKSPIVTRLSSSRAIGPEKRRRSIGFHLAFLDQIFQMRQHRKGGSSM